MQAHATGRTLFSRDKESQSVSARNHGRPCSTVNPASQTTTKPKPHLQNFWHSPIQHTVPNSTAKSLTNKKCPYLNKTYHASQNPTGQESPEQPKRLQRLFCNCARLNPCELQGEGRRSGGKVWICELRPAAILGDQSFRFASVLSGGSQCFKAAPPTCRTLSQLKAPRPSEEPGHQEE